MESVRITVIGDIMCEPLLFKSAKRKNGTYDFSSVYENVKDIFKKSEYVIGNFETPLAGSDADYVHGLFSFNSPDDFAVAAKNAGIDLFLTANNHCMDRGLPGLIRTLKALDENEISHTGTYLSQDDRKEAFYHKVGDLTIAVINYTYGTNYHDHGKMLQEEDELKVNLLRPQNDHIYIRSTAAAQKLSFAKRVKRKLFSLIKQEHLIAVRKALKKPYNSPRADDYIDKDCIKPYIDRMQSDIKTAKQNADIVLFCPHVGGQFNITPGKFTEYVFEKAIEAGCDAIVASHAHIVQKAEMKEEIPCFYSIGNFSMSPNSVYLLHEHLPEYGLAVHLYSEGKKIDKITFSILKIVEPRKKQLSVYPVSTLYGQLPREEKLKLEKDIKQIYNVVTGQELTEEIVREEYSLC